MQVDGVEGAPHRQVTRLVTETEGERPGAGGQPQQVGRVQRKPVGSEQRLGELRLQRLLEQAEAGAAADVGAERHPHTVLHVGRSGKRPLPRAALLVGQCATDDPAAASAASPSSRGVHVVGQHGAGAEQAGAGVGVDVVAGLREGGGDLLDLGAGSR